MSVVNHVDAFFKRANSIAYTPYLLIFAPLIVVCVRLALETATGHNLSNVHLVFNYFSGYLQLQIMLVAALALAAGQDWRRQVGAVSIGLAFCAWLPPVLDLIIPRSVETHTTYRYFEEFQWDFAAPYQLLGETITVWLGVVFMAFYAWWLTRSLARAAAAALGAWAALQVFAWAWIAYGLALFGHLGERAVDLMAACALATVFTIYAALNWKTLAPSLKRFNHALPWGLMAAIGARLAGQDWLAVGGKGLAMFAAFLLLTLANDYWDREQDAAAGGAARPITKDDLVVVLYFHVLLAFWTSLVFQAGFFLMVLFLSLGTAYHLPELRFKRLFCLGYKIEGGAAAAAFLFGAMGAERFPAGSWLPLFALLLFGGLALGSMFKDYKDIDQDRSDKIGTIYTRQLKHGRTLKGVHRFVALSTSGMFFAPPIWLYVAQEAALTAVAPLIVLAFLPAVLLLAIGDRKRAVELTMWSVALYLAAFLSVAPVLA
ncbi:MAG: hypothetical protein C4523_15965 [Myxococcales bacterium]|nr:MAG: hypothetical protein C4523_15965 [Myxococcales bacterium]